MVTSNVRFIEQSDGENASRPVILVIGTLDTKGSEVGQLAAEITDLGGVPVLLDSSTLPSDTAELEQRWAVIAQAEIARACDTTSEAIAALPRGEAVAAVRVGVANVTKALQADGAIDAAIVLGGAGAHIAGPVFTELPVGFPRLVVSPLASGSRTFDPLVGTRDVAVLHSIADIVGDNELTSVVYREAAGYIVGAAQAMRGWQRPTGKPVVAVSMNGNTTKPLMIAKELIEGAGYSFVAFHANGVGGKGLEELVASGSASAVLDYTTTELANHLLGGMMDSGTERMETAGRMGVPQVLVPGCVDFITTGRMDEAERVFPNRAYFAHNPELTLVRLRASEMAEVGQMFAKKANASTVPVSVCVPMGGFSVNDKPGGVFWDEAANAAFLTELTAGLDERHTLIVSERHIHDSEFVDIVVNQLLLRIEQR